MWRGIRNIFGMAVLFCLFSALFPCGTAAEENRVAGFDVARIATMIVDSDENLTYTDALALAKTSAATGTSAKIMPGRQVYWLVFNVTNTAAIADWGLAVYNSLINRIDVYVLDGDKLESQHVSGRVAIVKNPLPSVNVGYSIPLSIPPGETRTIALRADAALLYPFTIYAMPKSEIDSAFFQRSLIFTLITGAMLALLFYNMMLGFSLKDRNYLLYCFYVASNIALYVAVLGVTESFFKFYDQHFLLHPLFHGATQLSGGWFVYRFLDLPKNIPTMGLLFRLYFFFLALVMMLWPFVEGSLLVEALMLGVLVLLPLLIISGGIGVWRKIPGALYILIGWGILMLGAARISGDLFGLTDERTDLGGMSVYAAALIEMIVLSLALADRVRQLRLDKLSADQANSAKSTFLATMSHEIRTPLNGILATVEMLSRSALSEGQRKYVETIHSSGAALRALLNNVLDYAKAESRNFVASPHPLKIDLLVKGVVDLMSSRAQDRGIPINVTIDPGLPHLVLGDSLMLRQVLLNLLSNAEKFTKSGHINVRVAPCPNACIETGMANGIRFEIEDTGIGISQSQYEVVFEHFTQVDSSPSRHHGGTGLGLAIAKEMVIAMGGTIGVESKLGKGSNFYIDIPLPAVDEAALADSSDENLAYQTRSKQRELNILVVDDVQINCDILADFLVSEGHSAKTAVSGPEALDLMKEGAFDVIMMDLFMPGMDGVETTHQARKLLPDIPIIGVTAATGTEQKMVCLSAGMDDVLEKPLNFDLVEMVLQRVVSSRKNTQAPFPLLDLDAHHRTAVFLGKGKAKELLSDFITQGAVVIDDLETAWNAGRNKEAGSQSHKLAGMSGFVGLAALSTKARQLYQSIEFGDNESAGQHVLEIRDLYERSLAEISTLAE